MRVTSSRIAVMLSVAGLVIGGIWLARENMRGASPRGVEMGGATSAPERQDERSSALDAPVDTGWNWEASANAIGMPPKDAALEALWDTLQAPAQSGDRRAACRLAIETLRCQSVLRMHGLGSPAFREAGGEYGALIRLERSPLDAVNEPSDQDTHAQAMRERMLEDEKPALQRCSGYSSDRVATGLELLRAAALAGEPDAQALYAGGEGWFLMTPGALASPVYDQWTRDAPLVVARMLQEGHPDAPGLLAGAYGGQSWLAGLYEPDPVRAAAFLMLNGRLMNRTTLADAVLRDAAPGVRREASALAESLFERHYAGRRTAVASPYFAAGMRLVVTRPGDSDNTPAPCEPAPAAP